MGLSIRYTHPESFTRNIFIGFETESKTIYTAVMSMVE